MKKDYRSKRLSGLTFLNTSKVALALKEVVPVQNHGYELQVFTYQRIQVEKLSADTIKRIYELQNAKGVNVLETPNYFFVQYPGKSVIIIRKKDGRLYSLEDDGFSQTEQESQASFVLRMLHKLNLVEEVHSTRIGRKSVNSKKGKYRETYISR